MTTPNPGDIQAATLRTIWQHYRAHAETARRLKGEQGHWRKVLLIGSVLALLLTPFAKTLEKFDLGKPALVLTSAATVLFALMVWLHKEVLGDDSEQPWVRSRQTCEGLKALAFRFLGGASPFDKEGPELALQQAESLVEKCGFFFDDTATTE